MYIHRQKQWELKFGNKSAMTEWEYGMLCFTSNHLIEDMVISLIM